MSSSATSVPPDTAYGRLSEAWNETIRSVQSLDDQTRMHVGAALSEVGKAFADPSSLGTAVRLELDSQSVSKGLGAVETWLSTAPADCDIAEVIRKVQKLASDFKAHVERAGSLQDKSELTKMGTAFNALSHGVSCFPEGDLKTSMQTKMKPLRTAFQHSSAAVPVATAVVKLMKVDQPSMMEIIQDLESTSGSERPDGYPPMKWDMVKMSIAALRDYTETHSQMEDKETLILKLIAPPSFLANLSETFRIPF